jgi:ribose-phosphate pyrophosphokinase
MVVVTHGVLSGPALETISKCEGLKMVITSDTLPQARNQAKCDKIKVYSIAEMLAEVVRRTVMNKSFSSLMTDSP